MIVFTIVVTIEGIVHEECYYYIYIIDGDGPKQQNCSMVVAILDATIKHFNIQSYPLILDEEPLKCKCKLPSKPQDGKDLADLGVAFANTKTERVVDAGFSIHNPRCLAEALVDGDRLANCIVLLGCLVKHQDPIKKETAYNFKTR
jgi:hypothetical protein